MAIISINGIEMPAPSTYKVTYSDLDSSDSGRSETGIMQRNRVRQGVAKIELAFSNITAAEVTVIDNAIEPESFPVKYFFGNTKTATMYAGDRKCELKSLATDGSSYWDLSFNLVEY